MDFFDIIVIIGLNRQIMGINFIIVFFFNWECKRFISCIRINTLIMEIQV